MKTRTGRGKDANGWNARKNGKKIFRWNESAPVAYLSGGGRGYYPVRPPSLPRTPPTTKEMKQKNGWPNRHPCKWGHVYLTPP